MNRAIAALLSSMMLSACVATTPRIEAERLREVRTGATSYNDIVKHFGTPSLVSKNPDGTSFATYVHADPGASSKEVVPLVAGVFRDSVTFHFDTKGLLSDVKATSRTGERGTLQAVPVQPGSVAAPGSAATVAPGTPAKSSGGWLWRLPDWLPAAPRENR